MNYIHEIDITITFMYYNVFVNTCCPSQYKHYSVVLDCLLASKIFEYTVKKMFKLLLFKKTLFNVLNNIFQCFCYNVLS